MTFLPIVNRELRVASRRKATYRLRLFTAALAILFCVPMLGLGIVFTPSGGGGAPWFHMLAFASLVFSLLGGVFLTSDCLSEEKRQGTIGLLFLTDLKGYDIVLGKFLAHSLGAIYGLLALFPILGLSLLVGGVNAGEFWRMTLVLLNTLFFSLAIGIGVSARRHRQDRVMGETLAWIIALTLVLPVASELFGWLSSGWMASGLNGATMISPWVAYGHTENAVYQTQPHRFWLSLALTHGVAWLFLGVASRRLPRSWQDEPRVQAPAAAAASPVSGSHANQSVQQRARLLNLNPVLWLMSKDRQLPRFMWVVTATLVMVMLVMWWNLRAAVHQWFFFPMTLFFLVVKVLIAREASRFFVGSRRNGALELLLSTPLSEKEILYGHWLALKRAFLWPVTTVLGLQLLLMGGQWIGGVLGTDGRRVVFLEWGFLLVHSGTAVVDMIAAGWVGMWLGLSSRRPGLAFAQTLLYVVFLPWIVFCLPRILITLPLWFWARGKLQTRLRQVATAQMN